MTLERPFASVFPAEVSNLSVLRSESDIPYVPCEMLAPREAQLARWEFGTKESLPLLLLGWSASFSIYALAV